MVQLVEISLSDLDGGRDKILEEKDDCICDGFRVADLMHAPHRDKKAGTIRRSRSIWSKRPA